MVNAVRKALERLYDGRCTIHQTKEVFNFLDKTTSFKEVVVCENEPCRLSYSSVNNANQTETVNHVSQIIKLFIRPELKVLSGSKIEVTQYGKTARYVASGEPAIHSNHQEIVLTLEDTLA